jgi:hypothetical protein
MKFLKSGLLILGLTATTIVQAGDDPYSAAKDITGQDVVLETLILRPLGVVGTIIGTAFFIGTSPLTALASIAPPHNAFEESARVLVVAPFDYTFIRPFGVYSYDTRYKQGMQVYQ